MDISVFVIKEEIGTLINDGEWWLEHLLQTVIHFFEMKLDGQLKFHFSYLWLPHPKSATKLAAERDFQFQAGMVADEDDQDDEVLSAIESRNIPNFLTNLFRETSSHSVRRRH